MFCRYCGAQMSDDAAFCPKCGKPNATPPVQSVPAANQQKSSSGINLKILIPLAAVITILLVVLAIKVIGNGTESGFPASIAGKTSANGEDLSLDEIVKECSGCNDSIAAYLDLMNKALEYGYDEGELNSLISQYYNTMHHDCNADVTYVEGKPYVYRCCLGTYTGEWKGAGPSGVGEFIGKKKFTNNAVQYSGEWAYGLPEGNGTLYIQNFADSTWDLTYSGQMRAGMRDGTGHIYEYNRGASYAPMYRIYDAVDFSNDIMTSVTDVATYNANTKELLYYDRVTGDNSGWITMIDSWGADELNPEQQKMLEYAECAIVVGTVGAMVYNAYKGVQEGHAIAERISAESEHNMDEYFAQKEQADLDAYNAQQQQRAQDELAQQEEDRASKAQFYRDKYEEAINSYDPSGSLYQTKDYEYNMNYFSR